MKIMKTEIKTEKEYELVSKRVHEIFHAEPGTPENKELHILIDAIEDYEAKHYPIDIPDPIESIKIQMENLEVTINDLAKKTGKDTTYINDILSHKRHLTPNDIRTLNKTLHIPISILEQAAASTTLKNATA